MKTLSGSIAIAILFLGIFESISAAQGLTKPQPQMKIGSVPITINFRARMEDWNWFDTTSADDTYIFAGAFLKVGLGQQRDKWDWQVEGVVPMLGNVPDDAIAPPPQGQLGLGASYFAASGNQNGTAFIKQGFLRFKGIAADAASSLRLGRFDFAEGTEVASSDPTLAWLKRERIGNRLLGPFAFTYVQRSFDGVQYTRNTPGWNLTVLAARPTEGVFQLDGWGELDITTVYGSFTKMFLGESMQSADRYAICVCSELRGFAIYYDDGRNVLKVDNRTLPARQLDTDSIQITTVGGDYITSRKIGNGTADFVVWGAAQFGSWGLLDQRSAAIAVEAGYQFPAKIQPWVRTGYFRSTGDGDPTDSDHNTFFQLLPTPRVYARTPFYNLMNNEDIFVQFMVKPERRLSLRSELHFIRLGNEDDLWYAGGGAFQDNTFGFAGRPSLKNQSLGTVIDLSADFNFTPWMSVTGYIGGVRGGDVQAAIYPAGGDHPALSFFYLEFNQRF